MRKKLLSILSIVALCCFCCLGVFTACDDDHTHKYADNFTCHNRTCSCGHVVYSTDAHQFDSADSCKDRVCLVCGDTVKAISVHFLSTKEVCLESTCLLCGDTVPASCEHELEPFRQEPDCVQDGFSGQKCSVCGYGIGEILQSYGHDFGSNGKCKNSCGTTYNEYFHDELGVHTFSHDASCKARICTVCGKVVYATTQHLFTSGDVCSDRVCVICGDVKEGTHKHSLATDAYSCRDNICLDCGRPVPATVAHTVSSGACACGYKSTTANMTFKSVSGGYALTSYSGTDKEILIPSVYNGSPVIEIADRALLNNSTITAVCLPASIKTVGYKSFFGCENLAQISFEKGSKLTTLGEGAFGSCYALESVLLPKEIKTIGNGAFKDCTSLAYVDFSVVEKIDVDAFKGCSSLIEVVLPSTLKTLGYNAFSGCSALTAVGFENDCSLLSIGQNTFYNCVSLSKIVLPNTVNHIGANAFNGCNSLLNIVIPASVSQLHATAFANCKKLVHIKNLSNQTINVGDAYCEIITDTKTGFNTAIEYDVSGAVKLVEGKSKAIIGFVGDSLELDLSEITDVNEIYPNAFAGRAFTKVILPDCVEKIGANAFSNCKNLNEVQFSNESLLKEISAQAFSGCSMLFSFTLPSKVETIGANAFFACNRLVNFRNLAKDVDVGIIKNNLKFEMLTDSTSEFSNRIIVDGDLTLLSAGENIYLLAYAGKNTQLDLSAKNITGIYTYAFSNNQTIESIILPSTLKTIEEGAFQACVALTEITIPESVVNIGYLAFVDCIELTSVSFGANATIEIIPKSAFEHCVKLSEIVIPKSVKTIEDRAFFGCESLQTLTFEENSTLTTIGKQVFYNCAKISGVNIPASVVVIDQYAFYSCKGIEYVNFTFDSKIQIIGNEAFSGCSILKSLDLGRCNYLYEVGEYAFSNCVALEDLVVPYNVVELEGRVYYTKILKDAFKGCTGAKNLFIRGSVEDWIIMDDDNVDNGEFYRDYKTFVSPSVPLYYYSEEQPPQDGNKYWYYDNGVVTLWQE